MPSYVSHKVVEAAEITRFNDPPHTVDVQFEQGGHVVHQRITVPPNFFARGYPATGDYLVRYRDGYLSWSPREEFLDGYKGVDAGTPAP